MGHGVGGRGHEARLDSNCCLRLAHLEWHPAWPADGDRDGIGIQFPTQIRIRFRIQRRNKTQISRVGVPHLIRDDLRLAIGSTIGVVVVVIVVVAGVVVVIVVVAEAVKNADCLYRSPNTFWSNFNFLIRCANLVFLMTMTL